ncbi:MAG: hypothetical protein J5871_03830 [Bacteroidales bacterium]|nr:hypothetical protein [Bacteroidales bacterium]
MNVFANLTWALWLDIRFDRLDFVNENWLPLGLARLLLEMPLKELKAKTAFTGFTPMVERSILTALKRRQMQILSM